MSAGCVDRLQASTNRRVVITLSKMATLFTLNSTQAPVSRPRRSSHFHQSFVRPTVSLSFDMYTSESGSSYLLPVLVVCESLVSAY